MKLNNASSARTIRGTFIRWPLMEQSYKVVVIAYFKVQLVKEKSDQW